MENAENLLEKETELVNELVNLRLGENRPLEYESFEGYELPPRIQFSTMKKPTVTIKSGRMSFNMAALRLFSSIHYVIPMLHGGKKRLAIVPCNEEETSSVEWSRIREKDQSLVGKEIVSADFMKNIFSLMNWDKTCRYKVVGRVSNSERGLILIFDLEDALRVETEDYVDPKTGMTKKRQIKYYPEYYNGKMGQTYDEYAAKEELRKFEELESYSDQDKLMPSDVQENDVEVIGEQCVDSEGTIASREDGGESLISMDSPDNAREVV